MPLYPLNFTEFLTAIGEESLVKLIENADVDMIKVFSNKFKSLLKEYYYIGGMPEVVASYVKYKDYNKVRKIQNELLKAYENDFSKHVPEKELPKVIQIWNNFNTQLARENKKFIYGAIKESARASEYENAIRLLAAKNNLNTQTILEGNEIFVEYKGSLTEQYVLEELKSNYDITINYWSNDAGQAEVDFIIQYENKILPIEVKAEENLQAKSLKVFVEKYKTKYNIRTSMTDYRKESWLVNIPLYLICRFDKLIDI